MIQIAILSQNFKIEKAKDYLSSKFPIVIVSTNYLFSNERKIITNVNENAQFYTFADFLNDDEMASIDSMSYTKSITELNDYIKEIRRRKNQLILKKLERFETKGKKYLFSCDNDLGLDDKVWVKAGYKQICGNCYYCSDNSIKKKLCKTFPILYSGYKKIKQVINPIKQNIKISEQDVHIYEKNGFKYILIGKLNRIDYRFCVEFKTSHEEYKKYVNNIFYKKDEAQYLVPWHENVKCLVPDDLNYDVRLVQDGYLPSNYSDYTYHFKASNVRYYVWDQLGALLFKNKGLPYDLMPFRKKLYLPAPVYPKVVNSVLIATSASGDWTAQKNRSDDDILVETFIQVAKRNPNIKFIYRCHPNWILPETLGINSINRIQQLFLSLKLPNLILSSNIPCSYENSGATHTFARTSLEEDLKSVDVVFGEHSVSMIDAGFEHKLFCSVNLTNRRSFFQSVTDLGFPSCSSVDEICEFLNAISSLEFQNQYTKAISNFNTMTDLENI